MYESKKILAIIAARAGSKGLKNKNIIDLAGKPLIGWTIEAALRSRFIDRTIVSTDGPEIARIAKEAGADVPFLRPAEIAKEDSSMEEVVQHCITWCETQEKNSYDYIIRLPPTAPLRTTEHIDEAIIYYFRHRKTDQDTLVSVTEISSKYGWIMCKKEDGYINFCFEISKDKLFRKNLPQYYLPNGAIYMAPADVARRSSFYTTYTLPFVMDKEVSVDIDSKNDLENALEVLKLKNFSIHAR